MSEATSPTRHFKTLRIATENQITTITLDNPARKNAIGQRMVNELLFALADAHANPETRIVVLTGAGDAFCAGGDFSQMTAAEHEEELPPNGDYADLLLAMVRAEKPIIARVNGVAMGGGIGLVAASTFAIAHKDAKLATPEINVGLFPMMIMAVLARLVPRRKLLEMMLLGDRMTAEEACALGIVNRVVEKDALDAAVLELANKLREKSVLTLALGLRAYAKQSDMDLADALPFLRGALGAVLATDDAREGLMAFLEKRKPNFTGK